LIAVLCCERCKFQMNNEKETEEVKKSEGWKVAGGREKICF
jgi:hypothetical protein